MTGNSELSGWDYIAICVYFILVLATGFWSMFRSNRGTISGYFLAGRFITWLPVGASLFASNIGSEHFVGLAGSGAANGIGVGAFELNALIILQLLGWVFLPVYIASGVHTLPEYMSKRFGGQRIRVYLAVLSLILYIFTKISVNIYSGSIFVQEALHWNIYFAVLLVLGMTALCTATDKGGLAAVIYMDTLQCFLMLAGALGLSIYSFIKVGGYFGLVDKYMVAVANTTILGGNSTCGIPSKKSFTMLREPTDPDYPWPGFLFGQSPASIWYWAADQMIVQRALAAKSLSHAQGATIFAGFLKISPLFLIVMPGMISRVLFPDTIACVHDCQARCGNPVSCTNMAYPKLVINLMPSGARGIMLAGMLAALMSDLTSIFNSASTLFTLDVWHRIRPKATTKEMLIVGRVWVLVMVVIAVLWVPVVGEKQGGQLYIYIQVIAADLAPPIAAVYLLAVLWTRTNEKGAFFGLIIGFVIGVIRMIIEFIWQGPKCGQDDTRPFLSRIQYMYFALVLFVITFVATIIISLLTKPEPKYRLIRTTYWTRKDRSIRKDDQMMEVDNEQEILQKEKEDINEVHEMTNLNKQDVKPHMRRRKGIVRRGYDWFCGFDYSNEGTMKLNEFEAHLKNITTLNQTPQEKLILNVALIIIISIAVFLYIFFSIFSPIQG